MRIGIDARFVGPQGTGLGKYTEKLIENLAQIDSKNQYAIFLKKDNWDYISLPKNFKKVPADIPWYSLQEQLKMPGVYKSENLDLLHVPHFNVPIFYHRKFVVTIHDLIHHDFKNDSATTRNPLVFKLKRFAYKKVIKNAIVKSAKIIVPSNFVKSEIIQNFKINPDKIVVTYEAAEEEYFNNSKFKIQNSKLLSKYDIKQPFLIYVGNAYPHKNLNALLDAFSILVHSPQFTIHGNQKSVNRKLTTENLRLIIVCSRDVFAKRLNEEIKKRRLEDKVTMTGYIDAKDLRSIFSQARAYVFPSLSEGFGIPGLNAMASGLPVIASNIPVLKEVYDDAALYFDPNDPKDIASKVHQVILNDKIRSGLIKKGRAQVQKYSWRQMAKATLQIYEEAVELS